MSFTPRKRTFVAPPAASLVLDRDYAKQVAAKRTPRRGDAPEESKMSEDEARRFKALAQRRRHQARVAEANGGAPLSVDEQLDDHDDEAVLHLSEHLYDRRALVDFQRANDRALMEADRKQLGLAEGKQRADFVLTHYSASGHRKPGGGGDVTPRSGRRAPGGGSKKLLTLRGGPVDDTLVATLPTKEQGSSAGAVGSARGVSPARGGPTQSAPGTTTAADAGGQDGGGCEGFSGTSADDADRWMHDHFEEAPHLLRGLKKLMRAKEFARTCLEDTFYNAQAFFATVGTADAMAEGIVPSVTRADYIFALDPRFVDYVGADFVREVMEDAAVDPVLLTEEEMRAAIGPIATEAWECAAREVAQERAKEQQRRGSQSMNASPINASLPPPAPTAAASASASADIDEGAMCFVLRFGTQARATELRKLERRLRNATDALYDAQIQALRDEAISNILLADQERGIVR
uniref:Uncharacterized protein n=1 Tax=Neobodo designis TaxID=312471 RepID=A0A7S1M9B9_NEODS|mmetsp:Transcript_36477/g.112394  ORF Transcript_36477/g.112394 Transcript_36477/m.112394 type:complete len:464 (+) Transcript_36477:37-1428(+)